jgi:hypothetical protein
MSIDREKILKHLARVMNQVAESEETVVDSRVQTNLAYPAFSHCR